MRNKILILILSLFSITLSAQFVGDTLPSLPYSEMYSNNFNLNISGWTSFNVGSVSNANGKLIVTNGASPNSARGGYLTSEFSLKPSTNYKIEMYVDSVNADGFTVYSQWAVSVYSGLGEGWHTIKFTSEAAPGGFGARPIITPNTETSARVEIGYFRLSELNDHRDIPHSGEVLGSTEDALGRIEVLRNGEKLNINTLQGFPLAESANVDFSVDPAPRFKNFNTSSSETYDATNDRLTIDRSTRYADFVNYAVVGRRYKIKLNIDLGTAPTVQFQPAWGGATDDYYTIGSSGIHEFEFTALTPNASSSLNGLIFTSPANGQIYYIDKFEVYEIDDNSVVYTKRQTDSLVNSKSITLSPLVRYDYNPESLDVGDLASFSGGTAFSISSETMTWNLDAGANKIVGIGPLKSNAPSRILVYADVASVSSPVEIAATWSESSPESVFTISAPGQYTFALDKNINLTGVLGRVVLYRVDNTVGSAASSIVFNNLRVEEFPRIEVDVFDPFTSQVTLGLNSENEESSGISIGAGSSANVKRWSTDAGIGLGGQVAIGPGANTMKSRSVAVGNLAYSIGQSSTALGAGAAAWGTHQIALGRGATGGFYFDGTDNIDWKSTGSGSLADGSPGIIYETFGLYMKNGWAHLTPPAPSEIGTKGLGKFPDGTIQYRGASTDEVSIHGSDAHDARFPRYDAAKNYTDTTGIVWYQGHIFRNVSLSNTGNAPVIDTRTASWEHMYEDTHYGFSTEGGGANVDYAGPAELAVPGSSTLFYAGYRGSGGTGNAYNVAGGDLAVVSGRGTGTGASGAVRIQTAPPDGTAGPNEKNERVDVIVVSAETQLSDGTYMYLKDLSTGTLRRVVHKDKNASAGTNKIISFGGLKFE